MTIGMANGRRGWTQGCLFKRYALEDWTSRFQAWKSANTINRWWGPMRTYLTNGSAFLLQLGGLAALPCGAPKTADWRRIRSTVQGLESSQTLLFHMRMMALRETPRRHPVSTHNP